MKIQDLLQVLDQVDQSDHSPRGNDRAEKCSRLVGRILDQLGGRPKVVKFADRGLLDPQTWDLIESAQIDGRFRVKAIVLIRGDRIAAIGVGEFISHIAPAFALTARMPRGWRTSYKPFAKAREIALELAKEKGIDLED